MKKILIYFSCIVAIILLSGCSMENTPTKRVENFLNNYISQDNAVLSQLKEMIDSDTLMDNTQKNTYSDIMKRQYKDMTYEIKDETIEGNNATVTAEVEVYDYYRANKESEEYYNSNKSEFMNDSLEKDAIDNSDLKYIEYRLEKLKNTNERVKYTIDFVLTKKDDEWKLNDIDDITRQKLHGLYEH